MDSLHKNNSTFLIIKEKNLKRVSKLFISAKTGVSMATFHKDVSIKCGERQVERGGEIVQSIFMYVYKMKSFLIHTPEWYLMWNLILYLRTTQRLCKSFALFLSSISTLYFLSLWIGGKVFKKIYIYRKKTEASNGTRYSFGEK